MTDELSELKQRAEKRRGTHEYDTQNFSLAVKTLAEVSADLDRAIALAEAGEEAVNGLLADNGPLSDFKRAAELALVERDQARADVLRARQRIACAYAEAGEASCDDVGGPRCGACEWLEATAHYESFRLRLEEKEPK